MSLAYFPLYTDDFEADTAHLTLAEDGAYNRLLRLCWRTPGCSIPSDMKWVYRHTRAHTDEDKADIDVVLEEFFTVKNGRFSNARLSSEFLKSSEAHKRRVLAGSSGGKAKSLKSKETGSSNAKAMPKQPEPEPEPYIKKEDTNVSLSLATPDDARIAFDEFNQVAVDVGWPVARVLSKKRKAAIRVRLSEVGGIDGWRAALEKAKASPLCTGDNPRGWVADLDFLLQQSSFTKLMEGSYDQREPTNLANRDARIGSGTARAAATVAERRIKQQGSGRGSSW